MKDCMFQYATRHKVLTDTATILDGYHCKACIDVCCNDNFLEGVKSEDPCWDWWRYCSNKGCVNHDGEGLFQNNIKWVVKD